MNIRPSCTASTGLTISSRLRASPFQAAWHVRPDVRRDRDSLPRDYACAIWGLFGVISVNRAKQVRRAVLQMTAMIDYLLNSSRLIDQGAQLYFHPDEVDLRALLQEVRHLHREIAPRSPISQGWAQQIRRPCRYLAIRDCCFRCSAI
jgi:signal transduction histidine kinase